MTREEYLRTRFLERISHDTRGATGVSMGALDELESALGDRADLAPLLAIARRGLGRLLRLSESLADAAEHERGGLTLDRQPTDLRKLAIDATERARALLHRRGIELESHVEALTAPVDGPRLARAIFELTCNAVRSAREKVGLEVRATEDAIAIVVSDDGAGCPQPAPRFSPTEQGAGLGLGLALAADVATLHGGKLVVERDGDRTRVSLLLPR